MKKPYNAFKAVQLTNALRILVFTCVVAVILMLVLYFSLADNRRQVLSWLGFSQGNFKANLTDTGKDNDAGLNGPLAVNNSVNVRPLDNKDHLWGPIDAPVNLIIYNDFQCPFCVQFYDTVNQAKAEFGNDLVVSIRHFPLVSHDQAINAALAAECAADNAKFWEMYNELFTISKAGQLTLAEINQKAEKIGLDTSLFSDCLTKEKYKDKILSEKEEVKTLGIIGTPASFLNKEYLAGAMPYEDFTYPDGSQGQGLKSLIQGKLDEASRNIK